MLSRAFALAIASLPILAAATPVELEVRQSCSTDDIQCCNSVEQSNSAAGSTLLGLLGIVLQGVAVPLGIGCTPISVVGVGSGATW